MLYTFFFFVVLFMFIHDVCFDWSFYNWFVIDDIVVNVDLNNKYWKYMKKVYA